MARRAGCRAQILCVTLATGCAAVIDSASAFVRDTGVRSTIGGVPIVGGVTFRAVGTEHASVERRVVMAGYASRG